MRTLLFHRVLGTSTATVLSTRMMKDSIFCLENVLVLFCVTYWNIYINIVQIAKRHTSPVLASSMQTRPNILPDLVFAC